jgi:AraC-like DNA-binding protein
LNVGADLSDVPRAGGARAGLVGVGRVLLWTGGSLWIGRDAGRAEAHAHHAIQVSVALTGSPRLRSAERGEWSTYDVAVVPSHHRHEFDGAGQTVAQVFVEPETTQGRALAHRYRDRCVMNMPPNTVGPLPTLLLEAFENDAPDETLMGLGRRVVGELSGHEPPPTRTDPRIARAIEYVRHRLDTTLTLPAVAAVANLSPSRFRHVFVAQTGISFRAYLLWARVDAAIGAGMRGISWTEAAQRCGFADSAHLTRTCRRMFGIAPSMLVRAPR